MNYDKLADNLLRWIGDYTKRNAIKGLIVNRSDSHANLFVVYLCLESRRVHDLKVYWVGPDESSHHFTPKGVETCDGDPYFIADSLDGVIVSDITSTRAFTRDYHKYHDAADLYPLIRIKESDAIAAAQAVVSGCPTCEVSDDIRDVEWAMMQNYSEGIIVSPDPPQTHKFWFRYTIDQKRLLAKIHARYHATMHKSLVHATRYETSPYEHLAYPTLPDVFRGFD